MNFTHFYMLIYTIFEPFLSETPHYSLNNKYVVLLKSHSPKPLYLKLIISVNSLICMISPLFSRWYRLHVIFITMKRIPEYDYNQDLRIFKICLFLFVWDFSPHSRIVHSYGDVTIAGEGLQILTFARHSWPLSSEGSLAYHTHCDEGVC